jgi:hypothetical protein
MSGGKSKAVSEALSRIPPSSVIELRFRDGEILLARRASVLPEEGIIAFELIRSNRPSKYEKTDEPMLLVADIPDVESFIVVPQIT